jgi:elongation factor P
MHSRLLRSSLTSSVSRAMPPSSSPFARRSMSSGDDDEEKFTQYINGDEIKTGQYIRLSIKPRNIFQVTSQVKQFKGRGSTVNQIEGKCILEGVKLTQGFGASDKVELLSISKKPRVYDLLFKEGNSCMLMDPDTFDQIEMSTKVFGDAAEFLVENSPVQIVEFDGKPVSGTVAGDAIVCTVAEDVGGNVSNKIKTGVDVLLTNGVTIKGPAYLSKGDRIIVQPS